MGRPDAVSEAMNVHGQTARVAPWEQRVRRIRRCRICGSEPLQPVIHLGHQVLASLFDDGTPANQLNAPIPLEVVRCQDPGCGLLQLTHTVPPDVLYADYGYRSGINTTMRRHLCALAQDVEGRVPLGRDDLVVDIGANDGTTLLAYTTPGLMRVGFEPSNVRPETAHELIYLPTVFGADAFRSRFPRQRARVVTSIAMFYDLDDPVSFCHALREILAEDGLWVLEMSYLGAMLDHTTFDNICHEHLAYYSLQTLHALLTRTGFLIEDLSFNSANGGSLRCYIRTAGAGRSIPSAQRAKVEAALQDETRKGYGEEGPYEAFRRRVEQIRQELRETLAQIARRGQRVYGYGASTKGNVVLQYCHVGPKDLVAIAERNPRKVGRCTLGTRIPICSEDEMRRARPEYLLVLPWHFLEEFQERERALRATGTKFIVAFPHVRIL